MKNILHLYAEMIDEYTDEQAEFVAKDKLNYGWKFISIEPSDDPFYDYLIKLEFDDDNYPKEKPYGGEIFKK